MRGDKIRDNRTELDMFSTAICLAFTNQAADRFAELIRCEQTIDHPLPHTRILVHKGHWVIVEWTTENSTVMVRDLNTGVLIGHT